MEEKQKQYKLRQSPGHQRHRVEIWVRNDGTSCKDQVDDNYDEDLSKLDAVQVGLRNIWLYADVCFTILENGFI